MDKPQSRSLHERVQQLEKAVKELQRMLKQLNDALSKRGLDVSPETKETFSSAEVPDHELDSAQARLEQEPLRPSSQPRPPLQQTLPRQKSFEIPDMMRKSEFWLNKIGIGLLLFGVVFLFKYSIDQGWITPAVRVGFGLALGVGLLLTGLRIYSKRRHFSQILLGGAIATFYITGFSALQLYALVSYPVAFAFMVSVTLLALILSMKQNEAVFSLIGAIGGLGTPFFLYTGASNMPGLMGYTCLVLCGTSAIYFYRGWRSLLWTSVIGGWTVFLVALIKGLPTDSQEAVVDRWALQLGVVFGWLVFWAMPLIREVACVKNPLRWPRPSSKFEESLSQGDRGLLDGHVHLLSVSTPLITLTVSIQIWSLPNEIWGWITMGGAMVYGLVSLYLKPWDALKSIAYTHALEGVLLLTIALCMLLEGDTLLFTLATEAAVLHLIARRLSDKGIAIGAHILFIVLGVWLGGRLLFSQVEGPPIVNAQALTNVWVIGVALGITKLLKSVKEQNVYRLAAHVAILGWFLRELSTLPNGQGYVTIAWGVYAGILLVLGLRLNLRQLIKVAVWTLLIVVGKLFLVDLAELKAIWRVLLFLGFGGVFLVLSYYFQALWKQGPERADQSGKG